MTRSSTNERSSATPPPPRGAREVRIALLASLLLIVIAPPSRGAGPLESLSREELWRRAKASHNLLEAGFVVYDVETTVLTEVPSHRLQAGLVAPYRITFAFREDSRRITKESRSGGFAARPYDFSAAFDGAMSYHLGGGAGRIMEGKDPETETFEAYFRSVLNVPLSDVALASLDNSAYFPHCIRPGDTVPYRIRDEQEQVDGHWCYVVEWPDNDKLWIDPEIGYHFRQRVRSEPIAGEAQLSRTYALQDFFEAAPGFWAPRRASYVDYTPHDAPRSLQGKPWQQVEIVLHEIRLNQQVRDEDLDFPVPGGAPILMPDGTTRRALGNRSGLLAELAGQARSQLPWSGNPWFIGINVLAAVAVLALVIWHWRRTRRAARGADATP
jgi:hypothetical protein